ncbi:hypothetical protein [uncultured Gammaproteobacteria bacterium]|nr:hypothetical protein [uncultured Gammaproteobacteria bacterium]
MLLGRVTNPSLLFQLKGWCDLVFGFGKKIMDGCKNRSAVYKTYFSIYKSYSTFY